MLVFQYFVEVLVAHYIVTEILERIQFPYKRRPARSQDL